MKNTTPARQVLGSPRRRMLFGVAVLLVSVGVYGERRAAGKDVAPATTGNPLAELSHSALDLTPFEGTVEERLPAGGYNYLAVRLDDGSLRWTVTVGGSSRPGDRVRVRSFGRQTNFVSARLHRTFSELVFGMVSASVDPRGH